MNETPSEPFSPNGHVMEDCNRKRLDSFLSTVEVLVQGRCCWIQNALTVEEQIDIFNDILEQTKHVDNSRQRPCMNPSPKTLIFNNQNPTLSFGKTRRGKFNDDDDNEGCSLSSVYKSLILQRAISLASQHLVHPQNNNNMNRFVYNRYSVGVIRYKAPNEAFPEHIDHCNDPNGWVVLLSLGCTAKFTVQKEEQTGSKKKIVELKSGDILVFDPSTKAAVKHGVSSIVPSTCPELLIERFGSEIMANYRYGVQLRTSYYT